MRTNFCIYILKKDYYTYYILRNSVIDELITTDTVQRPAIDGVKITTLTVAGLLGEAIKRIHNNSSVNSLFEFKGGRTS